MFKVVLFFVILALLQSFSLAWAEESDKFPGDAQFEFRYFLPDDSSLSRLPDKDNVGALRSALKKDPSNLYYQMALGAALVNRTYKRTMPKGKLTSAQLRRSINRVKGRGDVKRELGRARKLLDSVLNQSPHEFPQAYFVRGVSYLLLGKYPEALADFNSALLNDMENPLSADAAFAVFTYMWKDLSDDQKFEWASLLASGMGGRLAQARYKTAHDYLLIAKLYYMIEQFGQSFLVIEMGLELDPANPMLLDAKEQIQNKVGK